MTQGRSAIAPPTASVRGDNHLRALRSVSADVTIDAGRVEPAPEFAPVTRPMTASEHDVISFLAGAALVRFLDPGVRLSDAACVAVVVRLALLCVGPRPPAGARTRSSAGRS